MELTPRNLLPWHREHWARITRQYREQRMPHALLFSGPGGVGKLAFARRLANYLLCERAKMSSEPCGQCSGCQLFFAGSHPDYRQIEVETGAKVIKIEQIREINEYVTMTSSYRGFKVAVVVAADMMNNNAANALLKTLEEPPAGTCLILVAAQPSLLPATIRSRTQQMVFALPDYAQALEYLRSLGGLGAVEERLALGLGAPLAPLPEDISTHWKERNDLFDSFVRLVETREQVVSEAQLWAKSTCVERFDWLAFWLVDLIRLKLNASRGDLLNPDRSAVLQRLAKARNVVELFDYFDKLNEMRRALGQNANITLALEALFVRMTTPLPYPQGLR